MKIEIKCRFSGSVLYSHEAENNSMRVTLEAAISARANLAGAYLAGANLSRANLAGADLSRANLAGANLAGADLSRANLAGADLSRANLAGANLAGADLSRANLAGAYLAGADLSRADLDGANLAGAYLSKANLDGTENLIGERPIFQIGPIGSRGAYFVAYLTNKGLRLRAGCFFGDITMFRESLTETHGESGVHADEYKAALALIERHAELWTAKS
jgi:uncharacterized protein YjbI with pentapeptide repeats